MPPQALEVEKAILGAVMLEGTAAYERVAEILTVDCFYTAIHQAIWAAILYLHGISHPIDLLTVAESLKTADKLEMVGGPYGLTKITNDVSSSAHIEYHALIVYQYYLRREIIRISSTAIRAAYDNTTDVLILQEDIEAQLFRLMNQLQAANYRSVAVLASENMVQVTAMQNRTIPLTGVPTGYFTLDHLTNGWQPTDLIIVAARPSVGKTAFALNLARNAAASDSKPTGTGIFSLEMSAGQLMYRFASMMSGVPMERIVRGRMNETEIQQYHCAIQAIQRFNIQIDDTGGITIHQLRRKARQMVAKQKVGLLIIDYLQLMNGDRDNNSSREQEISSISRGLKALAKELQVPIIALSQLNRAIDTRQNKEPQLSDLRESGAIEQDADIVMFLSRSDYGVKQSEADPTLQGNAFIKIAKHRNGDLETLSFITDLSIQLWSEYTQWTQVNAMISYTQKSIDIDSF